jgi:small-conductance mechanosensitive channel
MPLLRYGTVHARAATSVSIGLVASVAWLFAALWAAPVAAQVPSVIRDALESGPGGRAAEERPEQAQGDGTPEGAAPAAEEAAPSVAELVPREQDLAQEGKDALETIGDLTEISEIVARAEELEADQARIASRLDEALRQEYVRDDRVATILQEASFLRDRLGELMDAASARLSTLDDLRRTWRRREEQWGRWREELRSDPQLADVYREPIAGALETIGSVLEGVDAAVPELVEVQQRLQAIESGSQDTVDRAQRVLRTWRQSLLRRNAPVLLSPEHRQRLGAGLVDDLRTGVQSLVGDGVDFRPRDLLILLLQVVLAVSLGVGLRRLRPRISTGSRWASVLRHPWAIGLFVAAGGLWFLHGPLPPAGRLAQSVMLAASAAVVASGMFSNPAKRVLAYGISAAFVLFAASEASTLPVPLLRLLLAGLSLAGIALLALLARRSAGSAWREQRWFVLGLRSGVGVLAVILITEVLGYHFLAQWLLEASVVTAFAGFVVTFLLRLGRGALYLLFRADAVRRSETLTQVGRVLSDRLLFLLKVGLVGFSLLYLASVWDLAESPAHAWERLVGLGISLGERRLTVGKLLLASVAVYLAWLGSWVTRTLLDRTVFERREFERGVRDSFFTLLHYTLIVLGVFLALSLVGVDLSTFALVAGALGVGIGFGLQNVVNNFVSGLILLFERPVRIGDIVDVGTERGEISKIGLRSTVLTTFDGAEQIIPNGDLISEKVVNWTLTTPRARLAVPVSVAYGNDPERVIEVLQELGREYELAQQEPAPMAIFTGFGDSSLDFELRIWLRAFDELLRARSELAARIVRRLADEGIEIPFPQRDLHLRSVPPEASEGLRPSPDDPPAPGSETAEGETTPG